MFFFNGKARATGIREEQVVLMLIGKFVKMIKKKVDVVSTETVNVTGCDALGFRPDCKRLCMHLDVTYESELFSTMYYQRKVLKLS